MRRLYKHWQTLKTNGVVTMVQDNASSNAGQSVSDILAEVPEDSRIQQIQELRNECDLLLKRISVYGGSSFTENSDAIQGQNSTDQQLSVLTKLGNDKYAGHYTEYLATTTLEYKAIFHLIRFFSDDSLPIIGNMMGLRPIIYSRT